MSSMSPITTLFEAAEAASTAKSAQAAPASSNNRLDVVIKSLLPVGRQADVPPDTDPRAWPHIACRLAARQYETVAGCARSHCYSDLGLAGWAKCPYKAR